MDRVDVYVDGRPRGSSDVTDGATTLTFAGVGAATTVQVQGFASGELVAAQDPAALTDGRAILRSWWVRAAGRRPSPARRRRATGLTAAGVAERVAAGRTNATSLRTSRTVGEIVRANVFTVFNGVLATLFVLVMTTGRWQNALFGLVVVANAAIGIVQELRAKRTLDRLAILNAPRALVVRDGAEVDVPVADVVLDDLLALATGDQVPADGVVRTATGLALDESLLTGEAEPVVKHPGDAVWSGAFVVSGHGRVQTTAVGEDAYAARLSTEARRFTTTYSELVAGTNQLLRWIAVTLLVVGPAVLWSQIHTEENTGWRDAVTGTVAALVGMVPEGLVLLTTLAFVVATVGLARRHTLVQELPAVEGLARVDVVCLDKTGTLTDGDVRFDRLVPLDGLRRGPGRARGARRRRSVERDRRGRWPPRSPRRTGRRCDACRSRRPASGRRCAPPTRSTWVLGAPEMVLPVAADAGRRRRAGPVRRAGRPGAPGAAARARGRGAGDGRRRRRPAAGRSRAGGAGAAGRADPPGRRRGAGLLHRRGGGAQGDLGGQPAHRRCGRRSRRGAGRDAAPRTPSTRGPCRRIRTPWPQPWRRAASSAGSPRTRSGRWCSHCNDAGTWWP